MTPQVLVRYLEKYIQRLLKYWSDTKKSIYNDSSNIVQIPRKEYSMTPQVLATHLEKYIQ